jgi:hypothetical protein
MLRRLVLRWLFPCSGGMQSDSINVAMQALADVRNRTR